jgi:Lanthionine-containing peptide SapB precursor RamS
MALLDLQTLDTPTQTAPHEAAGSEYSALLCDSTMSYLLCL